MRYRYYTVDVFTNQRFGGNQLAVLPDAAGLSSEQMQAITREFNYSESTFVLPPTDPANTRAVRIFTPERELPFAGHPNVGTAYVLAMSGAVPLDAHTTVRFEEGAGIVPVGIQCADGKPQYCELRAPGTLERGTQLASDEMAAALGLNVDDIVNANHAPLLATVGISFILVELANLNALARVAPARDRLEMLPLEAFPGVLAYTRETNDSKVDVRARMFASLGGIREDPATGSANCALSALLADLSEEQTHTFEYSIAQGVEMGRPSELLSRVEKVNGRIEAIYIGGQCVAVTEGEIEVG
ncbi:MAG: PhzF family phenazine biosynthesis protein [Gammaproteobacteria bacterium]|nr:PhzF family phenazine biosynthesis protein [Gammaproteobacteria bacterium]